MKRHSDEFHSGIELIFVRSFKKMFKKIGVLLLVFCCTAIYQNCTGSGFKLSGFSTEQASLGSPSTPLATPSLSTNAQVPVYIAQGHVGRTLISCDDGFTWTHDISDDASITCYNPYDCDHSPSSAAGIVYNDNWLFAAYGHGAPGTLRRSQDGYNWEIINSGTSGGGLSFVNGILLWLNGQFALSRDLGVTMTGNMQNVPNAYFAAENMARVGSTIIVSADENNQPDAIVSQDSGQTWQVPTMNGIHWGRNVFMVAGNGMLVTVSDIHEPLPAGGYLTTAYTAHSTDNGMTWTGSVLYSGGDFADWAGLYFDGIQFVGWFDNQMWKSADGINWTGTTLVTGGNITSGPITRGPSGNFVAIPNIWGSYYAGQKAYRSTDGLNWTQLDSSHFTGGHPIWHIINGYVNASACP